MSTDFNYGFDNAKDLLEKLKRDRASLNLAINEQNKGLIIDSVFNFAVTGHSIKDWLKNGYYSSKKDKKAVEEYINDTPMLRLCADLCNGSKHKLLTTRKEKDDPVHSAKDSELTMDMGTITMDNDTITMDSDISAGCYTVRIELTSGRRVEILDFASQVVDSWASFFKAKGL